MKEQHKYIEFLFLLPVDYGAPISEYDADSNEFYGLAHELYPDDTDPTKRATKVIRNRVVQCARLARSRGWWVRHGRKQGRYYLSRYHVAKLGRWLKLHPMGNWPSGVPCTPKDVDDAIAMMEGATLCKRS